jgi:putative spermidine/putrescine transport system substrate-binding protein
MSLGLNRRRFGKLTLGAGALAPLGFTRHAWAQGRTIYIGIWGGAQGEFVKKEIIPQFEADFECTVLPEEGFTLANISKMRATRDNPKYSVMFVDDVAIPICKKEGLIAELPLADMPAAANLYDRFLYEDGYGTGLGVSLGGLFHNTGVEPPASYADLWGEAHRRNIKLVSPKNTPSVFFLIVSAAVATGKPFAEAQYEIDGAWETVEALKPNVQNIFESGIQAANEVAQGQADIGMLEYSKYVYPYTAQGAPVTMGFPAEGSFAGTNCQVLVEGGPERDLAVAFMNRMLEPQVAKALAEFALIAPPVAGIEFSDETLKYIAYPASVMDERGLFTPDWTHINANRSAWTEKLNQIFSA